MYDVVTPERRKQVEGYPNSGDFFRDLPVLNGAVDSIRTLSAQFEIFFVTAAMEHPNSFEAKYAWLRTHFDFIDPLNYVFCGYKGIINADYLIDDTPHHLDNFDGQGLLFTNEHNLLVEGYDRVDDWAHVVRRVLE